MLDKNQSNLSVISEAELKEEFNCFFKYIDDCNRFNVEIKEYLEKFKNGNQVLVDAESDYKRKIEDEIILKKKHEQESLNLVNQIKAGLEKNIVKLKDHHEKQISNIIEKHKLEVQKWKSKYEKIKFDKKVEKTDSDDEIRDNNQLKIKVDLISKELQNLKSENLNSHQELNKFKKVNKDLEEHIKENKKHHSKLMIELESKEKELTQCKLKIKNFETFIESQNEKLKSKETKIEEIKSKYEDLSADYKKLNNEMKKLDQSKVSYTESSSVAKEEFENMRQDLALAKIDLRSANRELTKKTEICNYMRQELNEAKSKITEYEAKFTEQKNYEEVICNNDQKIKEQDCEIMNLKCTIDENVQNMDLQVKELSDTKANESKWKNKCCEFEKKNQIILGEIECIKRKSAQLKVELDKKTAEIEKLTGEKVKISKRHEELKKVCQELESQVENYSQKYCEVSSAKKSLIKQKSSASDEVNNLKMDLDSSHKQITKLLKENENLSNQLTNKELEFKSALTGEKIQFNKLVREFDIEQEKCIRLEERICWLETCIEERDKEITHLSKDLSQVSNKLSLIKEEAAKHITMISMLTKENQQLMDEMKIKSQYEKTLQEKVEMFRDMLNAKEADSNRDRITWNETFSQQMKLIDYLKNKAEENGKKKSSIFTLKAKDNLLDKLVDAKYEDSHKSFKDKKIKTSKLNEQFKENIKQPKSSIIAEKIKDRCDNYSSNITDSQKKNKSNCFISQNNAHNFSQTTVKFTTLCVSCANDIYFGQKAKKCQQCSSTVHLNCSLVNNCGLPIRLVRQTVLDNFHHNSLTSNSMSHQTESDDIEPSAPNDDNSIENVSNIFKEELDEIINSNKFSKKKNNIFDNGKEEFSFTDSIIDLLDQN